MKRREREGYSRQRKMDAARGGARRPWEELCRQNREAGEVVEKKESKVYGFAREGCAFLSHPTAAALRPESEGHPTPRKVLRDRAAASEHDPQATWAARARSDAGAHYEVATNPGFTLHLD
jgi:hypothetical protein